RDPIEDFEAINAELLKFNPEMTKLPQIVAGNKIDMASDEQIDRFRSYVEEKGYEYFDLCAPIREGTQELINAVAAKLATLPPIKRYETSEIPLEALEKKQDSGFRVRVEDGIYIVEAEWLVPILSKIDYDDYESLQYLQRILQTSGIDQALLDNGIRDGDTVSLYDMEFDYVT
ncbi:MAG: Obg family GTPase CgtA, partial [Clostridia bacterium]|nr:Obg family GTPase CgtA [Clostridia bacterium]